MHGCMLASWSAGYCWQAWGFIPHFCIAAQPNWIQKISDVHAAIEENVFWECHASGRPKPSYRWLKDGEPLLPQVGILLRTLWLIGMEAMAVLWNPLALWVLLYGVEFLGWRRGKCPILSLGHGLASESCSWHLGCTTALKFLTEMKDPQIQQI